VDGFMVAPPRVLIWAELYATGPGLKIAAQGLVFDFFTETR